CTRGILFTITYKYCTHSVLHLNSFYSCNIYSYLHFFSLITLYYILFHTNSNVFLQENQWFWSDGTPFDYTIWDNGEPNNLGGHQHCIQMNCGDAKAWDDVQCWTKLPSICAQ
uniref:C-type lectin domain-containing protein n=1 Tax=Gasterosteus aculeatus aculeatus TaxID=481459 RepID=A0AAQ4QDC5_GASAC